MVSAHGYPTVVHTRAAAVPETDFSSPNWSRWRDFIHETMDRSFYRSWVCPETRKEVEGFVFGYLGSPAEPKSPGQRDLWIIEDGIKAVVSKAKKAVKEAVLAHENLLQSWGDVPDVVEDRVNQRIERETLAHFVREGDQPGLLYAVLVGLVEEDLMEQMKNPVYVALGRERRIRDSSNGQDSADVRLQIMEMLLREGEDHLSAPGAEFVRVVRKLYKRIR